MQMVDGSDKLLDEILKITGNDCHVYLDIIYEDVVEKIHDSIVNNFDILINKIDEDDVGATYNVVKSRYLFNANIIWLCNVNKEILGIHPNTIAIKIIKDGR
jgi:aromatic ring-cleaving dioxygenase